jgi:DNA polymerase V
MTDFDTVMEALTAHATRAAEKLRQHGLMAGSLTGFYHTSRFKPDKPNHRASRTARLTPMTNDTFDLVSAARRCAESAWKGPLPQNLGGYEYDKAGVMLDDLLPIAQRPLTLFDEVKTRSPKLMAALDVDNNRYGKKSLVIAREGFAGRTAMKQEFRSPRYTTRISDVPVIRG